MLNREDTGPDQADHRRRFLMQRIRSRRPVGLPPGPARLVLNRRSLLRIGGLGALGLNLSNVLRSEARGSSDRPAGAVRSCLLIFYYGGLSHHDTWDMKPDAPREVRGEFRSIATSVPGIRIGEHMPRSARVVDRLAIIRSLHHPMTNHNA